MSMPERALRDLEPCWEVEGGLIFPTVLHRTKQRQTNAVAERRSR
jgi:hypothetical protein